MRSSVCQIELSHLGFQNHSIPLSFQSKRINVFGKTREIRDLRRVLAPRRVEQSHAHRSKNNRPSLAPRPGGSRAKLGEPCAMTQPSFR
jgi:hypothetical protein